MTSSAASKNKISGNVPIAASSVNIVGNCSKKPRVRTSSTTASRVRLISRACRQTSGSTLGGRLSTTYQPRSSRLWAAVERPAPDMPLTTTSRSGLVRLSVSSCPSGLRSSRGERPSRTPPRLSLVTWSIIPVSITWGELDAVKNLAGSHVDRLGLWCLLQRFLDRDGRLGAEARYGRNLLDGCRPQLLHGAEVFDQCLTAHLAKPRHLVQ